MGQSPRRLLGWSPRTITRPMPDGATVSTPEPEYDWIDVALLLGWERLQDDLCPRCGRPIETHKGEHPSDYDAAWDICPAVEQLDIKQAEKAHDADDEALRKDGRNPERARIWSAWRAGEPRPPDIT